MASQIWSVGARTRPYATTVQRLAAALELHDAQRRLLHTTARALSGSSSAAQAPGPQISREPPAVPIVGRVHELNLLLDALAAATLGRGSLIAVSGAPGIGKTALCTSLAKRAHDDAIRILVGHCYEMSAARPYTPFVEALHRYVVEEEAGTVRATLADFAPDLAHLLPALAHRLSIQPSERTAEPEEDRYRLLQAVIDGLRAIAARRPLLLILEDLHDADPGTLDLLIHLSRQVGSARLLVVVTYRDADLTREHRVSATLPELLRSPFFNRISLHGLTTPEVRHLLEQLVARALTTRLAAEVQQQTECNPLFVREVAHRFISPDARLSSDGIAASLPSSLREAIEGRLSKLTPGAREVLTAAAVIGHDFNLGLVARVVPLEQHAVMAGLDEAVDTGVVELQRALAGVATYRFAHAYFRRVLYDAISAPRRMRLHTDVARAIEAEHASGLEDAAAELAEHLSYSSDPDDLAKAIDLAEVAARRATDVYAHDTAVALLQRARELRHVLSADASPEACDALLALGDALIAAGQPRQAVDDVAPQALRVAERLADRMRAFKACALALNGLIASAGGSAQASAEYLEWAERAAGFAEPDTTQDAEVALSLALARLARGKSDEAIQLFRKALTIGRRRNHTPTMVHTAAYLMAVPPVREYAAAEQLADEFTTWSLTSVPARWRGMGLFFCATIFNSRGDYQRGDELWRQLERLAEQTKASVLPLYAIVAAIIRAQAEGRLDHVLTLSDQLVERAEELGSSTWGRNLASLGLYWTLVHLGRAGEFVTWWEESLRAGFRLSVPGGPEMLACCHALVGNADEARARAARCLTPKVLASADGLTMSQLGHALQLALLVEDRPALESLSACLWPWRHSHSRAIR